MTKTAAVTPGTRITSAWGNTIRDRTVQRFATKSELDLTWSDAGDGAMAITLDDFRLWVRRGGRWLPPLTLPLGVYFQSVESGGAGQVDRTMGAPPGSQDRAGDFDQYRLLANRMFQVIFSCRYELRSATVPVIFGAVINVTGTGNDAAVPFNAGNAAFTLGVEACVFGWPMTFAPATGPDGYGSAYRASTSGLFRTTGTPGAELDVKYQHVIVGTPAGATIRISDRNLSVIDIGPAV